jgi:putative phosphonate metabolism protein
MSERFAIYYAPATTHLLWSRAVEWLGRDPADGSLFAPAIGDLSRERLSELTVSARRYGFHATLKAPMELAEGTNRVELEQSLVAFGLKYKQVSIGRLKLTLLDGFLALVPEHQSEALTALAGECVAHFEPFRRPMGKAERERRIRSGLSAYQIALLDHYGYPYVMDQFLFHMTLSDRLDPADREPMMCAAQEWFGPVLGREVMLDRLSLFHEAGAGAPFMRLADFPLSVEVKVDA